MNESEIKILYKKVDKIDPVQLINQYAIYSTFFDDPIFRNNKKCTKPIFCGGKILSFKQNVYNFKVNEFVVYISCKQNLNIELSSNLIFKLSDKNNLKLVTILPYASYAMKIFRKIDPKLGQNIVIIGLNFFSILLVKLFKLSGANTFIIKLEKDLFEYKKIADINKYIINGLNESIDRFNNIRIDSLILVSDLNQKINDLFTRVDLNQKIQINQISTYDKGFKDPSYIKGIKYPYSYVRWDYRENLKFFIYLVEKKIIDISFIEILNFKVSSIKDLKNSIKDFHKNVLILFEIQI